MRILRERVRLQSVRPLTIVLKVNVLVAFAPPVDAPRRQIARPGKYVTSRDNAKLAMARVVQIRIAQVDKHVSQTHACLVAAQTTNAKTLNIARALKHA